MTLRPGLTQDAVVLVHETFCQAAVAGSAVGEIAATATQRMPNIARDFKIDSVQFSLPAGFVANATAYWTVALKNGSTTVASWSTQTTGGSPGGQGTITANTPVAMTLNATDANLVFAAGATPTLVITKTGAAGNLTAGTLHVHGKFVS